MKKVIKNGLVDKGFEIYYYNLSYRRRFIRTLWMIPWIILVLGIGYLFRISIFQLIIWGIALIIILIMQLVDNFKEWRKERKKELNKF